MPLKGEVPEFFQNELNLSYAMRALEAVNPVLQQGRRYVRILAQYLLPEFPTEPSEDAIKRSSYPIRDIIQSIAQADHLHMSGFMRGEAEDLVRAYLVRQTQESVDVAYQGHVERQAHNDRHQLDQTPLIPVEKIRREGVQMGITEEGIQQLHQRTRVYPDVPLIWQTNTSRIYKAEMLPQSPYLRESKGYHILHDIFDHMYTFDLFERAGLFARYAHLLDRLGNPHITDMFGRESEYISTIMGEWRVARLPNKGLGTMVPLKEMKYMLGNAFGTPTANQRYALERLNAFSENSPQAQQIEQMYGGTLVVLLDQFRKHGYSYDLRRNPQGGEYLYSPDYRLALLEPEYLAFFIEGALLLSDHENEIRTMMRNASFMIEEQLQAYAHGRRSVDDSMRFTLDDIRDYDPTNTTLSQVIQDQLSSNVWYMADWSKREGYELMG